MIIYSLAIVLTLIIALFSNKKITNIMLIVPSRITKKHKVRKKAGYIIYAVLCMLPLTIISSIRYFVGADYGTYIAMYENANARALLYVDSGFIFFLNILRFFSNNSDVFFVTTSVIVYIGYAIYIGKESDDVLLSIMLFFVFKDYFRSLNVIRQYVAIAIIIFAIPEIRDRKWLRALVFILMAGLLHSSAVIMLPIVILSLFKLKPNLLVGTGIVILLFGAVLRKQLYSLVSGTLYGRYFTSVNYGNGVNFYWEFGLYIFLFILIYIIQVHEEKNDDKSLLKINKNEFNNNLLFYSIWIQAIIYGLTPVMPANINRVTYVFSVITAIYLPGFLCKIEKRSFRYIVIVIIMIPFIYFMYKNVILNGNQNVIPYMSIFSR